VSEEPCQNEQPEHGEGQRQLQDRTQQQAEPGSQADMGGMQQGPGVPQLAGQGTDERAQQQAQRPEPQAGQGSQRRAPYRQRPGTDPARAQRRGQQVHRQRQQGQQPQQPQGKRADALESFGPGG